VRATLTLCLATAAALGCAAADDGTGASSPFPSAAAGDFTIALIPDTQYYAQEFPELFLAQMRWIADHAGELELAFAIHLGDMTNSNTDAEWRVADAAMQILDDADVPWSPMPGNHDGIKNGVIATERYNAVFPPSRFADRPWFGGHFGETSDSTYWLFSAGGMDFMVVSLAFGTPVEQLEWADEVIAAHPGRRVIVATHAYLDDDGSFLERGEEYGVGDEPLRWTDGRQIWDALVSRHDGIFLAVCGHVPDQGRSTLDGVAGNPVHNVLANYQGYANGGDGWLRLLRFSPSRDVIYVEAYSPLLERYDNRAEHSFALPYAMDGR
jgi:3',5'-cyclic AMP phosphodiesterase CpdA